MPEHRRGAAEPPRFTSVQFHRFKAFEDYSVSLRHFNILVGPNNCGKSTILGAFRILAEAMRKARSRNPTLVRGPGSDVFGYAVDLSGIPVATENVFYDYIDSEPATVSFRLSNGNELLLFFPRVGVCHLICYTKDKPIRSTSDFKRAYDAQIGFVPILGPVEHDEELYKEEAARLALLSHRAARNFRNIWHHYPDDFEEFRSLVRTTWPGMDIERPRVDYNHSGTTLHMFCPEDRIPREIYWAGFGFQVWCQMLTFIIRSRASALFLIDEPDIYLHADLQRQLVRILRLLGPDILIATHSTEIITNAEPDDLLVVNKRRRSARRIHRPAELQDVFQALGSNLNPVLTQLAKTRRAVFVEGKDFSVLSRFAGRLGKSGVANQSGFAVIPVDGFSPSKVKDFVDGIRLTIGGPILAAVVFDRDYRSEAECSEVQQGLEAHCVFVRIHSRKEIENFLLSPVVLQRAIESRLRELKIRTGQEKHFAEDVLAVLKTITDSMRRRVEARYLERRRPYERTRNRALAEETITEGLMREYDVAWSDMQQRLKIAPGKEVLSSLNVYLQATYGITISPTLIVDSFGMEDIEPEMRELLEQLNSFSAQSVEWEARPR